MSLKAIDLFAGLGGNSQAAREAGIQVIWSANHCELACRFHSLNHPECRTECQDLHQADFSAVPNHDILIASPSCKGHTVARGREAKHHDAERSTAWAVIDALAAKSPRGFLVENVQEMARDWLFYPEWVSCLQKMGYQVNTAIMESADFGVPQNRKRLYVVGLRGRSASRFHWPEPTANQHLPILPFLELDSGTWNPVDPVARRRVGLRPLVPHVLETIRAGQERHRGDSAFLVGYYGSALAARRTRSANRPIGTVPCKDRWLIVRENAIRWLSAGEGRKAMGFPAGYILPANEDDAIRLLGNAVTPPLVRELLRNVAEAIAA